MALENMDPRRGDPVVVLLLASRFDLYLGAVVWFTRLLLSLLVRLQSKTRIFLRLRYIDRVTAERDVSALPATLRSLRIRTAHHHSKQPAVSLDHSAG